MAQEADNMVLRTVYLPPELDQRLKAAALLDDKSKNDIIRELIRVGIDTLVGLKDVRFIDNVARTGKPVVARKSARLPVVGKSAKSGAGRVLGASASKVVVRKAAKAASGAARSASAKPADAKKVSVKPNA